MELRSSIYGPHVLFLIFAVLIGLALSSPEEGQLILKEKRGGARPFFGSSSAIGAKRLSGASPYYFYQKRGGGRAFVGGYPSYGVERRGGGRAFSGSWQPREYLNGFYDAPYFKKRSANLWEYLQSGNDFYN